MERIVVGSTNKRSPVIAKFTLTDLIFLVSSLAIIISTLVILLVAKVKPVWLVFLPVIFEVIIVGTSMMKINEYRLYNYYGYMFAFLFRKKAFFENKSIKNQLGIEFTADYIKGEQYYSKIISVNGMNFSLFGEEAQDQKINQLANVMLLIKKAKFVKLDVPVNFDEAIKDSERRLEDLWNQLCDLKEKGETNSEVYKQLETKIGLLNANINVYKDNKRLAQTYTSKYYLIIYSDKSTEIDEEVDTAVRNLIAMGLYSYVLDDKEVKEFYGRFFDNQFDDKGDMPFNALIEKTNKIVFGKKTYRINTLSDFPYTLGNAWLSNLTSIKGVKVIMNFSVSDPSERAKTKKRINKEIVNLGGLSLGKNTESEKLSLSAKIESYQELLKELEYDKQELHVAELILIYEDDKKLQKEIHDIVKTNVRCKLNLLPFRQFESFLTAFPNFPSKKVKYLQQDFQSSSLAGTFPFISDIFADPKGDYLGENSAPVFFDIWANLNQKGGTRTNANIMTIGASGKGKSYLTKIMILNQLLRDCKVFILDPENEYAYISKKFNGYNINVAGGEMRINPFEIFPELDDDGEVGRNTQLLSKHLAFLGDFFQVVLPDLQPYTRQVLQNTLTELYRYKGIYATGKEIIKNGKKINIPVNMLQSKFFPVFDDLIYLVDKKSKDKNIGDQQREAYIELHAFMSDFEKDNRYGAIWNGQTTLDIKNDFIVFNFRGLDNSTSNEIRNGQMLLITRYLMREIINNYQYNLTKKVEDQKKIVLCIDEAHNFIDPAFPVALDLMKNMSKRIRKYSGSLWVATQNIADFVGFDVNTRTKATAVINNCQYTFLFGLKPDDIVQVKDMYSKTSTGALTQQELNYLAGAGQGDTLLMVDNAIRVPLHVYLIDAQTNEEYILQPKKKKEEVKIVPSEQKKQEKKNEKKSS